MDNPDDFTVLKNVLSNNGVCQTLTKCSVHEECKGVALSYNVCYIVAAVVFNQNGEVLLIQEAKSSCYQQWYLPAGRVDPNESLVEAVKREMMEEAGLEFKPSGVVCVEENKGGYWIRFTFTGTIVGGELKTTDQADKESLQAGWFSDPGAIDLRCQDILPLISRTRTFNASVESDPTVAILPVLYAHHLLCARVVFLWETSGNIHTILSKPDGLNSVSSVLPAACFLQTDRSIHDLVQRLLEAIVTDSSKYSTNLLGILGLEHIGKSSSNQDGIVFNLAVCLKSNNAEQNGQMPELRNDEFQLFTVSPSSELQTFKLDKLKMHTVPVFSFGLKNFGNKVL